MFTGLVQAVGTVVSIDRSDRGARLKVDTSLGGGGIGSISGYVVVTPSLPSPPHDTGVRGLVTPTSPAR